MAASPLLPQLASALRRKTPRILPASKRAAVAIVIRVTEGWEDQDLIEDFLASPPALRSTPETTEILYMKRAASPTDPWSGNVAFPGGRREPSDQDDLHTAMRETMEEVGLDLSQQFRLLGRLDDRAVYARGRRKDLVLCPFVFVQATAETPPLTLQASEVQAVRWVPISALSAEAVDTFGVQVPFGLVPLIARLPRPVKQLAGVETAHYPSILLRHRHAVGNGNDGARADSAPVSAGGGGEAAGGVGIDGTHGRDAETAAAAATAAAGSSLAARVASELASSAPPPSFDRYDDPSQQFQLWGLTLAATSDVLELLGRPRLNWPPVRFRSTLANSWVYAICGGIELSELLRGRRPAAAVSPRHVAWLGAAALTPLLLVGWATGLLPSPLSFAAAAWRRLAAPVAAARGS
jgi:8-oxo-dGTP pyrophosphatase MutT (NUDIX family)